MLSDGGPYENGVPADLEVFIGSAANDGNIRLKGNSSGRTIGITVPDPNDCGLATGPQAFDFQSLKVAAAAVVSGGIYSIAPGDFEMAPMTIRFADGSGDLFFLNLAIHFTLVVNQAILGLAPLAAKIGAIERGLSKASGGVH